MTWIFENDLYKWMKILIWQYFIILPDKKINIEFKKKKIHI